MAIRAVVELARTRIRQIGDLVKVDNMKGERARGDFVVVFEWVKAQLKIGGNEVADSVGKVAYNFSFGSVVMKGG